MGLHSFQDFAVLLIFEEIPGGNKDSVLVGNLKKYKAKSSLYDRSWSSILLVF